MNLLADPLLRADPFGTVSLPDLLAGMARGEVTGFPALRPHQRAAWHMFLVQLAVLAAERAGMDALPGEEGTWAAALRALASDWGDDPWRLVREDPARPAFLQPPDPSGLNWTEVPTPDALDMLITSKNHDLKAEVAREAAPEDWVFALVTLQTMEGYGGGAGRYNGIARMNGGSSSRVLLGLAPRQGSGGTNTSAWWRRDVLRLLALRRAEEPEVGRIGGPALLWCLPWPEGQQLNVPDLDPLFIEVCRRVRLARGPRGLIARKSTSAATRVAGKLFNGALGDPWAPVHRAEGKSLTLGDRDFGYGLLCELLFGGDWKLPPLARPGPGEDPSGMVLVAEALARGNSRTDGLRQRVVPLPKRPSTPAFEGSAAAVAATLTEEIAATDRALRAAIALYAARGEREAVNKDRRARAREASDRLRASADALFFPALWERLEARLDGDDDNARHAFQRKLVEAATAELRLAFEAVPVAQVFAPRAQARAERMFRAILLKEKLMRMPEAGHDE